ncbi:MAG: hypothetical protein IPK13_21300 [Deltaproteobacteria bacterium]|nr:hypothetical protein [Deltaproteobacteria bacterium]
MARSTAAILVGLWTGCGVPGSPSWSSTGFRPPRAAAETCLPPYPTFEAGLYWLSDLERSAICTVAVERDECIVSILHDCTAESAPGRSWLGRAGASDQITFALNYPPEDAPEGRDPGCCRGTLEAWRDGSAYSLLECSSSTCDAEPVSIPDHLGFFLEKQTQPTPFITKTSSVLVGDGPIRKILALSTRDARDIVLAIATFAGRPSLFAFSPNDPNGPSEPVQLTWEPGTETQDVQMAEDPERRAFILASGAALARFDTESIPLEDVRANESLVVGGHIEALAISGSTVVVATATTTPPGHFPSVEYALTGRRLLSLSEVVFTVQLAAPLFDLVPVPDSTSTWIAVGREASDLGESAIVGIHDDGQLDILAVGTDIRNLRRINDTTLAYTDVCAESVPNRTCYFELSLTEAFTVRRLAVPGLGAIDALELIPDSSLIAARSAGVVAVIDRAHWRPWIAGYAAIDDSEFGPLFSASSTQIFAASRTTNAIGIFAITAQAAH